MTPRGREEPRGTLMGRGGDGGGGEKEEERGSPAPSPSRLDHGEEGTAAEDNVKMEELDRNLHAIGFRIHTISAHLVSGSFVVTPSCCQPFRVLHGGVSALIAEALGSIGAHVASGFQRVAGVQLSINHLRTALPGELILAQATPLHVGRTIQVWDVGLWKKDASNTDGKGVKVASSRVTLLANLPVPESARDAAAMLKKYAKL